MVVGVVVMVIAGLVTIATNPQGFWGIATAVAFGGGVALTLDEFALILHLENVYWHDQGRVSVDAVIVTIAAALLFLGGLQPFNVAGASPLGRLGGWVITVLVVINVTLAVVCFLKGKLWTGLLGCFVPVVALVGAVRLARPGSPWSRRYRDNPVKRERAERRDQREAAMVRAWRVSFYDLIAGKPHIPHVPRVTRPAPRRRQRRRRLEASAGRGRAPGARQLRAGGRHDRLEVEQKPALRRDDLLRRLVEPEPGRPIDLGDLDAPARPARPLELEGVADEGRRVELALECPGVDDLVVPVLDRAQRHVRAPGLRPVSSANSRRAAVRRSSPPPTSPLGIDHTPASLRAK